jgi:hypothetical protein
MGANDLEAGNAWGDKNFLMKIGSVSKRPKKPNTG